MRRPDWSLHEVISTLQRDTSKLISTQPFLKDLHDHVFQSIDTVETCREMVSSMQDLYLSSVSNRINEVMKVLTIFAAIFIPLTFMAGIYSMNFDFMPELHWKWSYLVLWVLILIVGGSMLLYFRKKRWL